MNAFASFFRGWFPPLLRYMWPTTTTNSAALRPLLSRQLTLGSFVNPKGLTTWTTWTTFILPATGFCAANAMRSKRKHRQPRQAQMPLASRSAPVAPVTRVRPVIAYNSIGKGWKKGHSPESPKAHGRGRSSSRGHQQQLPFQSQNIGSMAGNAIYSPSVLGEMNRFRAARSAHQAPTTGHSNAAWFRITDTARLAISQGDITTWRIDGETDAIVNAANQRMLGGGGVDGAIHRKAGPGLKQACLQHQPIHGVRCPIGEARATEGFDLPASRVIHTVGPRYYQDANPAKLLADCYWNSLHVAIIAGIQFIAFPAISCGVYAYPLDEAAKVSLDAIKKAVDGLPGIEKIAEIHFVHFEKRSYDEWMKVAERDFTPI